MGSHTTSSLHYKLLQHRGSARCWNSWALHIAVHPLLRLGQGDASENRMKGENIQGLLPSFPLEMSYCTFSYFHFFCFEFNLHPDHIMLERRNNRNSAVQTGYHLPDFEVA